jgi:hypothetical protein
MAAPQLFTASYAAMRDRAAEEGVQGVRSSVGPPWFWREACRWPMASQLAPYRLIKIEDDEEFAARYVERLERHGVEAIRARLAEIAAQTGARDLVLCCFERVPSECHRGTWARWWRARTGQAVPELRPGSSAVRAPTNAAGLAT